MAVISSCGGFSLRFEAQALGGAAWQLQNKLLINMDSCCYCC